MGRPDRRVGELDQESAVHRALLVAVQGRVHLGTNRGGFLAGVDDVEVEQVGDGRRIPYVGPVSQPLGHCHVG